MNTIRNILAFVVVAAVIYFKVTSTPSTTSSAPGTALTPAVSSPAAGSISAPVPSAPASAVNSAVPQKALNVLQIVRTTGQPPDGYVGGRVFENREGRLAAGGDYREFDVDPHNGQRNAERLIVEWNTKKAWYTGDHYQTFIPLP